MHHTNMADPRRIDTHLHVARDQARQNFLRNFGGKVELVHRMALADRSVWLKKGFRNFSAGEGGRIFGISATDNSSMIVETRGGARIGTIPLADLHVGGTDDEHTPIPAEGRMCVVNQNWNDPSQPHKHLKKGQYGRILAFSKDYMTVNVHWDHNDEEIQVPAIIIDTLAREDMGGHIARSRSLCVDPRTGKPDLRVQRHQPCVVLAVSPQCARVSLKFNNSDDDVVTWPSFYVQFGAKPDREPSLRVTNISVSEKVNKPDDIQAPTPTTVFKYQLEHLLTTIYVNRHNIHALSEAHMITIDTPQKRKKLANAAYEGLMKADPNTLRVFAQPNGFTLSDLTRCGIEVKTSNYTAGLYFRVHEKFRDGDFANVRGGFLYVGSTGVMQTRNTSHTNDANNPDSAGYNSRHYRAARAAKKTTVKQFLHLPDSYAKPYDRRANEVLETCFMLMFGSVAGRLVVSDPSKYNESNSDGKLTVSERVRAQWTVLSNIAAKSLKHTKWGLAEKKMGGLADGLNASCPIDRYSHEYNDKMLWTSTHVPQTNRTIFRRIGKMLASAGKDTSALRIIPFRVTGKRILYLTTTFPFVAENFGLKAKTEVGIHIEIMDEGREHPTPYYNGPLASPFRNGTTLRRLGVAITWDHNGKSYRCFVRAPMIGLRADNPGEFNGAQQYSTVAALITHFTGIKFKDAQGNRPSYIEDMGLAQIMELTFERFRNEITARPHHQQIRDFTETQDPANAKQAMQNFRFPNGQGLSNVDGPWRSTDYATLREHAKAHERANKVGVGKQLSGKVKAKSCDRCKFDSGNLVCKQKGTTNTCEHCAKVGLPCSWTSPEIILGDQTWTLSTELDRRQPPLRDFLNLVGRHEYLGPDKSKALLPSKNNAEWFTRVLQPGQSVYDVQPEDFAVEEE